MNLRAATESHDANSKMRWRLAGTYESWLAVWRKFGNAP